MTGNPLGITNSVPDGVFSEDTPLGILNMSDQHIGNRLICDVSMVNAMMREIEDSYMNMPRLDLIIFSGDLFDRFLVYNSDSAATASGFIQWLITFCIRRGIHLRVLEGTPSHDWKQPKHIRETMDRIGTEEEKKLIRYVDVLEIEYIEALDIDILYLPDEWKGSTVVAWDEVQQALADYGQEQVDFVVMHGQFAYQFDGNFKMHEYDIHNPDNYNSIAKYAVYCGHVHNHSIRGKIVVPGSFNRLAHGHESPKGYIRSHLINGVIRHEFIENTSAWIFKTYDMTKDSVEDAFRYLSIISGKDTGGGSYPEQSYIRVLCRYEDKDQFAAKTLQTLYPRYSWKVECPDKPEKRTEAKKMEAYHVTPITEKTVVGMVVDLAKERGMSEGHIHQIVKRLEQYV